MIDVAARIDEIRGMDAHRAMHEADALVHAISYRPHGYHLRLNLYPRKGYTVAQLNAARDLATDTLRTYPGDLNIRHAARDIRDMIAAGHADDARAAADSLVNAISSDGTPYAPYDYNFEIALDAFIAAMAA